MSYGFQKIMAGDETIIDQNYRNPHIIAEGTIQVVSGRAEITFPSSDVALLFVKLLGELIFITTGTMTATSIRVWVWDANTNTAYSGPLTYFVAAPASVGAGGGYGMAIFRDDGKCCFSTSFTYPFIKEVKAPAVIKGTAGSWLGFAGNYAIDSFTDWLAFNGMLAPSPGGLMGIGRFTDPTAGACVQMRGIPVHEPNGTWLCGLDLDNDYEPGARTFAPFIIIASK